MWLNRLIGRIRWEFRRRPLREPNLHDPSEQLRLVEAATFTRKKVMHFLEYKVFLVVEEEVASLGLGARVFAQTALGEIIRSDDRLAYKSINSKRADIIVIGADGFALAAVEYQGTGHFQQRAATKDAVKREALRKAGIQYVEISDRHSDDEIRQLTRAALRTAVDRKRFNLRTSVPARDLRSVARWDNPQTTEAPEGAPASRHIEPAAQTE
jgi:hypothetical protein